MTTTTSPPSDLGLLIVVGVIVLTMRRAARAVEDPAVAELKRRLAAGEI